MLGARTRGRCPARTSGEGRSPAGGGRSWGDCPFFVEANSYRLFNCVCVGGRTDLTGVIGPMRGDRPKFRPADQHLSMLKLKRQQNANLCTKEQQPRKKITIKLKETLALHTNARHLHPAPPQQTPKKKMMGHLLTQARRSSIANTQLCGPSRWLATCEAIAVEQIKPGQHTGHVIELQIWHPCTTKTLEEETIPVCHESQTQHTIHHLRDAANAASAPRLPPKLRTGAGANAIATAEPEDTSPPRECRRHAILA